MGLITALWLVPLLALVIVLGFSFFFEAGLSGVEPDQRRRYWLFVIILGRVVTVIRVGICWWDTYRAFIRQESLSGLPLLALLMPEFACAR